MSKLAREINTGSILRTLVEAQPKKGLGAEGQWRWKPTVNVNREKLDTTSPTTEYSSVEANE